MKNLSRFLLTATIFVAFFTSCEEEESFDKQLTTSSLKTTVTEDFEDGSKAAYAEATVELGSGTWNFDQALIGSLSTDRKSGSQSVRVRNTGIITMEFDKSDGAGTVSIYHAVYGSDGSSTWALYLSTDSGSSWTKVGGTVTSSSTSLQKVSFDVDQSGDVRFEIRKLSGGSNRINFDDFTIVDYGSDSDDDDDSSDDGSSSDDDTGSSEDDDNLLLGNPSDAVASTASANNYLMDKEYYVIGYSNEKLTPIWVSWHLDSDDLGSAARQNDFRADDDLPSSWYAVTSSEFSGSGFDRGHMCPSADRKSTVDANSSTFLMTNMIPQSPNNNRVTWVALENYARDLVDEGKELYIISGPDGQGGTGSNGYETTVGEGVVVPAYVWKIIVVLDDGDDDLNRITSSTRVIAVYMPNDQDVNDYSWYDYRVSVDYIESQTGFDFLSNLGSGTEASLEAEVDDESI